MRLPRECYQMQQVIETHLPHLSRPQLTGLALWVCGAIFAGSACQNAVESAAGAHPARPFPTVPGTGRSLPCPAPSHSCFPRRTCEASALSAKGNWNSRQYLRSGDGSDRARPCQTELDDFSQAPPSWWLPAAWPWPLKGDQITAIVISVVYRSCAIPVWRIHKATQKGSWMDPNGAQGTGPSGSQGSQSACAGAFSPKLWKQIVPRLASLYALPEEPTRLHRKARTTAFSRKPAPLICRRRAFSFSFSRGERADPAGYGTTLPAMIVAAASGRRLLLQGRLYVTLGTPSP